MNFTIHEAKQGTPEWLAARAGRVTGSKAADVLAKIKTGEAAARRDYKMQLVCERLTGQPQEGGFVNKDMEWGNEQEPFARAAYEVKMNLFVRETGFLSCNDLLVGCSLDGDVNDFEGIQEFKCPKTSTHIKWMLAGVVPAEHKPQMIHNMWVTGAGWCDFASYDPRLPEALQLFIVRLRRNEDDINNYQTEVFQLIREIDQITNELLNKDDLCLK